MSETSRPQPVSDMDVPETVRATIRELTDAPSPEGLVEYDKRYRALCDIYRHGVTDGKQFRLGPTGQFPYGRHDPEDEGELSMAVGVDPSHGLVRLQFGKPVGWLALPPYHARQLATILTEAADRVARSAM